MLGDKVLVEVATRLQHVVRDGDLVARFGGDEFVVMLPGTDQAAATEIAHRLLTSVNEPMELEGQRLHVSASIGVAVAPQVDPDALLRSADAAVYHAKAQGRAQVCAFVDELSAQAEERLQLSNELRDALSADALHLLYQPVVQLQTGDVLGIEALARWDHPSRGPLPPDTFVAVAEKTGLARLLDDWVLRRACREFATMRRDGTVPKDSYVAVNVTAASVTDVGFPTSVAQALTLADLPAEALVLEITETGVMADVDTGIRVLAELRQQGVRVAIDDFGTGWSSLTYLRQLPATILKLDRSFVTRVHQDEDDLAIAASVIRLGQATGMEVIAEGVELPAQLSVLRQLGCTAGQGFFWQRPVPTSDVAAALARIAEAARA